MRQLVVDFGQRLAELGWVTALHVGGSMATSDHRSGVSDLDLVAVTEAPLSHEQRASLMSIHAGIPPAAKLGCCYVPAPLITIPDHKHTTWTHGRLIERRLSGLARAELTRYGFAVFGPEPTRVWAPVSTDDVREAVIDELAGYWTWAVRRPWLWSSTDHVDLSVTTMLRARHTLATGELISKSAALDLPAAGVVPGPLVGAVRARRDGLDVSRLRFPLGAVAAFRLTRCTIEATSRPAVTPNEVILDQNYPQP